MLRRSSDYNKLNENESPKMFKELEEKIIELLGVARDFSEQYNIDEINDVYILGVELPESKSVETFLAEKIKGLELNQKSINTNLHSIGYDYKEGGGYIVEFGFIDDVTEESMKDLLNDFYTVEQTMDFKGMGDINDRYEEAVEVIAGMQSTASNIEKAIRILEGSYENMMANSRY